MSAAALLPSRLAIVVDGKHVDVEHRYSAWRKIDKGETVPLTPEERAALEDRLDFLHKNRETNRVIAIGAYETAAEGNLIGATNIIMNALTHGFRSGPRTAYAIANILIESGYVDGEIREYQDHYELPRSKDYERLALAGDLHAALLSLLFADDNGACKMVWGPADAKLYNARKWLLHDSIQRNGGHLTRGGRP